MKEFTYVIKDELGIHARPAGLLVKEAAKFPCTVRIIKGGKEADGKKLFSLMGLAVKQGDEICVACEGEQEAEAAAALAGFIAANL